MKKMGTWTVMNVKILNFECPTSNVQYQK